jgi:hypothetical protein
VILAILESGPGEGTLEFRLIFVSLEGVAQCSLSHLVCFAIRAQKNRF